MKLILTEAQFNRLPLIVEDIQDSPMMSLLEKLVIKNKQRLNGLYLELKAYNVHNILFDISLIEDLQKKADGYADEVDNMARKIEAKVSSVPEEMYDRNEQAYEDIRNKASALNDIIYKKQSVIEKICYALIQGSETLWESEGEYNIYINKAFTDIKTLDV